MLPSSYYIVGGFDRAVENLFSDVFGYRRHHHMDEADVVIFTGGCDVSPGLYQEAAIRGTYCSEARDDQEMEQYFEAFAQDKRMIGICRGAQLIHVMQGNKLWQDIDGHGIGGNLHPALDLVTGKTVDVTSCHHQMMRVDDDDASNAFKVVAIANMSSRRNAEKDRMAVTEKGNVFRNDVEVLWYPNIQALCYQGHPEYQRKQCLTYFTELMKRYGFLAENFQLQEIKSSLAQRFALSN